MKKVTRKLVKISVAGIFAAVLALMVVLGAPPGARADAEDAKRLVKAMSDYMAAQKAISFTYDADLEVVSKDHQKLALLSSGTVILNRPDKIRATRMGGFSNVEMVFDGKTLTLLGKNENLYAQVDIIGTIDHLIDELRHKHKMPLPAADLLMTNIYEQLMPEVMDIKDLGSGVISGVECDHLAFRTKDEDWQIWIAQGDRPYPRQYVITSKFIPEAPQYTIQVRDWKTGDEAAAEAFSFKNIKKAERIDLKNIAEKTDEFPENFKMGGAK